jgi:catechol 2,3-dioxygenase-like lactoylglutathione lyase family enzyme
MSSGDEFWAMSSASPDRPPGMTSSPQAPATRTPTTLTDIGVVMFTVADQDAALAFYTEKLGFELRGDSRFGEHGEMRWLEVAPPGSRARLALNPPMGGQPGGGGIGVETPDVLGEHARLSALGVDVDPEPERIPGAPLLFMLRDPDGNHIAVVEAPPAG